MAIKQDQQYREFILQLYDKGLLSSKTALKEFDFDIDQEIKSKKEEVISLVQPNQKRDVGNKIEQARRNFEALLKGIFGGRFDTEGSDVAKLRSAMIAKAYENMAIMSEVKDI